MFTSSGTIAKSYTYQPFGGHLTVSDNTENPFQFVGEFGVTTEPNGLNNVRARWFAPVNGRFLSKDPLGQSGGGTEQLQIREKQPRVFLGC